MKVFSIRIKELRNEQGLTQKELADKLQVSNSAVCDWERERTQPDLEMLVKLANLSGVTVDYLLGNADA